MPLLPPQVKLYAELIAVLAFAAFITWGVHHLREQGRQEILAANARADAAAVIHKAEVEALVHMRYGAIINELEKSRTAPPPADALSVRVCKPGTPLPGHLPANGSPRPPADGTAGLSAGVEEGRDIGPFTEQLLKRANAQVKALQEYVRTCQEAGICRK